MDFLTRYNFETKVEETANEIKKRTGISTFRFCLVLGTGSLGIHDLVEGHDTKRILYEELENPIPLAGIEGHPGEIQVLPEVNGAVFFGRGHSFPLVTDDPNLTEEHRIHYAMYLGALAFHLTAERKKKSIENYGALITTDAVGGLIHGKKKGNVLRPGDFGLVDDYEMMGVRGIGGYHIPFVDFRGLVNPKNVKMMLDASRKVGVPLYKGTVYSWFAEPDFETSVDNIRLVMDGHPFVGMTGYEAKAWFSRMFSIGRGNDSNNVHLCIVSDTSLPKPGAVMDYIEQLPDGHPNLLYARKLLNWSQVVASEQTTHHENDARVRAALPNLATVIHKYVADLFQISHGTYRSGDPLFRY